MDHDAHEHLINVEMTHVFGEEPVGDADMVVTTVCC